MRRTRDYLATEQTSERRHEFIDGVIVAMAGGFDEHNALTNKLAGRCRSGSPDQRFWIDARGRGRYADGSIICGPPAHPPFDDRATTNPVIVVEVLSPSTESDDDGDKRLDFQSLASLEAYVLVAQDERRVKVYRRAKTGWSESIHRTGETFELPHLTSAIAVAEIYDGILDLAGTSTLQLS